jgi:hypothetical protein
MSDQHPSSSLCHEAHDLLEVSGAIPESLDGEAPRKLAIAVPRLLEVSLEKCLPRIAVLYDETRVLSV